jgi:L-fuconolactonase
MASCARLVAIAGVGGAAVTFDVLDSQVHLTPVMTEDRILTSLDALGIRSVLIDEFWAIRDGHSEPSQKLADGVFRPLSPYAQAAVLNHPDRCSYLQRVDRRDPEISVLIPILASSPGCRALRVVLLGGAERDAFSSGGYDVVLRLAEANDLPVCLLGVDVRNLPDIASRFGDLQIVLDHCGWARSPEHWNEILQVASQPNVWMKWSHSARAFGGGGDPGVETQRQFERAIDAFGVQRLVWASDITQEESRASWRELLSFVLYNPALSAGDKEWLLARSARQLFRWPVSS